MLTILFTTKALKVSKGGVNCCLLVIGKGMTVYPLQSAVTAVAKSLNDILIWHTGGMKGGGHVVPVVMQAEMREAVALQKSGMA